MTFLLRRFLLIFTICVATLAHAESTAPNMLLLGADLSKDAMILVGERGTILRSTDSGKSWQRHETGVTAAITSVSFAADGLHGWVAGHGALILTTTDGGETWSEAYQGENREDSFLDIHVVDQNTIIAVGAYGYYVESRDAGLTWKARYVQDEDSHLNRITRASDGTLYLAGERGSLLASADKGLEWQPIPAPYQGSFYGILPLQNGKLLAHGLRGHIYLSDNHGEDWSPVSIDSHPLLSVSYQLPDATIILAGQSRAFLISKDGGTTFQPWTDVNITTGLAAIIQGPDGKLWGLGEAGLSLLPTPQ